MRPARNDRLLDAAERHRLLSDPTRLAVLDALSTGERTIPELVEVTRMHRNTVRNHVVRLEAAGLIEASPGEPGGRGRPAHLYRLRDPAETGDGPVFVEGLVALLRRSHGEEASGMAESEGERIGERLCGDASPSTPAQVVRQVARMLARLSFEPTVHRRRGGYRIDLHHCPFWGRAVDRDGDVICAFHRGLIRGAMHNASVHPTAMRLLPLVETDVCRTEIEFQAT